MDFLYIFMNHLCPSIGAVIALIMFGSPLKAVMRADKEKALGVGCMLLSLILREFYASHSTLVAAWTRGLAITGNCSSPCQQLLCDLCSFAPVGQLASAV